MRTMRSACALLWLAALGTAQQPAWRKQPATVPAAASGARAAIAYDAVRRVCVAVVLDDPAQQTWEYDGSAWTQRFPAQSPATGECKLAWGPTRGRVLCVTGSATTAVQVQEWTGSDWNTLPAAHHPVANDGYAIAFDLSRARLVLQGGNDVSSAQPGAPLAETWEWDGTNWQQVGNGGPVPCREPGMAYDSARQRVVLFGGEYWPNPMLPGVYHPLDDTWEWDGQQWAQHFGIAAPARRSEPALAFDGARGVTVLFGGRSSTGIPYTDVWEWNGIGWTAISTPTSPPASGPIAYDADRDVTVALVPNGNVLETWEYRVMTKSPASVISFGAGCSGSGGTPSMSAATPPITNALYSVTVTNLPPSPLASVFGMIGVSNTSWGPLALPFDLGSVGMPGCWLLVSADFVVLLPIAAGQATWNLQIPDDPLLVGGSFYQQALVFDPGTSPRFGTVSNALAATVGNQ